MRVGGVNMDGSEIRKDTFSWELGFGDGVVLQVSRWKFHPALHASPLPANVLLPVRTQTGALKEFTFTLF